MFNSSVKKVLLCGGSIAVGVVLFLFSGMESVEFDGKLRRNESFEQSELITIDIISRDIYIKDFEIDMEPKVYSEDEFERLFDEAGDDIISAMLGANKSTNSIDTDLQFFEELPGFPFSFEWWTDDSQYFDRDGRIINSEPFDTNINCVTELSGFSKNVSIPVHVTPSEKIVKRIKEQRVKDAIAERVRADSEEKNSGEIILPDSVNGDRLYYFFSGKDKNPLYLISGIGLAILFAVAFKKDEKKEKEELQEQMLREYTVILQSFSLYIISGMSVRKVWTKIWQDSKKRPANPVYDLMAESVNELANGISESTALQRFAEKTQLGEYVRMVALIAQSQKRGSTKLNDLLKEETTKAFIQRKQNTIKKGEQAGTKLLFPMMLILMDVMVMIIIPAFWNV